MVIYGVSDVVSLAEQSAGGLNLRYRKWRKNGAGVSPVIAVILMVAITVVLAAVLYTLVGIIVDEPPEPPQTMGATLERVDTGWKVTVIQGSVSANETNYFVEAQNGSIAVKKARH